MPKQLQLRVNTSQNSVTDYLNRAYKKRQNQQIGSELFAVNGDVVTVVCDFNLENDLGEVIDFDLTGALSLRCSVSDKRESPKVIYSVQDTYNTGIVPANEDLASGLVTWLVFLDPAAIDTVMLEKESIESWLDVSWVTPDGYPQTLLQVPMTIYQQIDSDLIGSPPPSVPTYLTAAEVIADYVAKANYINPTALVAGAIPDADGRIDFIVDTTAGDVSVTLGAVASYSPRFSPNIVNLGTNKVIITPDGVEEINGGTGAVEIVSEYGMLSLLADQTNGQWIAPVLVVP